MAQTQRRLFSRETEVRIDIEASPERVWALLVKGADYPTWTSTVLSIAGEIGPGQRIELKSSLAPTRTFKLTIQEFSPPWRLVWGDAMGRRTYQMHSRGAGTTFVMHERIGGPLFPLFARLIPPFDASFDQFARDLKARAEAS
ncbi:MAG: SRPBCC domain-containing protein [Gemmatimonadaceae bacterium]